VKSYAQTAEDEEKAPVVIHSGFQAKPDFKAGDEELFDLVADPYSSHNLAADPDRENMLNDYRQMLFSWWQKTGGKTPDGLRDCSGNNDLVCQRYLQISTVH
jgi:hypothetical protein